MIGRALLVEEKSETAEYGVGFGSAVLLVEHLFVGQLENQLRRRIDGDAHGMELELARAGRRIHVGSFETRGLQILVRVAVELHRLPRAAEIRADREVIG